MSKYFQGELQADPDHRFAIVVSRYNSNITEKLLVGAEGKLKANGVGDDQVDVFWVPGAWEIPLIAEKAAASKSYAAVICLGCVVQGETSHDQHINRQVSLALGELSRQSGLPVTFGLLTCYSMEQAIHRAGGNVGNKGEECAEAALEMVSLIRRMPE